MIAKYDGNRNSWTIWSQAGRAGRLWIRFLRLFYGRR